MRALGEVTNPTGRLPAKEFDNRFRFHTAAQRWAAGMEAETPPLTGSDHVLHLVVAGTGARRIVCAAPDKLFLLEMGRGRRHRAGGL